MATQKNKNILLRIIRKLSALVKQTNINTQHINTLSATTLYELTFDDGSTKVIRVLENG